MGIPGRSSILWNIEFKANYVTGNFNHISSNLQLGVWSCLGCSLLYMLLMTPRKCKAQFLKSVTWEETLEHRYSSGHRGHPPILDGNEGGSLQTYVFNATCSREPVPSSRQPDRQKGRYQAQPGLKDAEAIKIRLCQRTKQHMYLKHTKSLLTYCKQMR